MILEIDSGFKRSFKRLVRKTPQLQDKILETIELLSDDPFIPSLKSHKLTGQLDGLWSRSVSYDCELFLLLRKVMKLLKT